jgi:hypothetical protein
MRISELVGAKKNPAFKAAQSFAAKPDDVWDNSYSPSEFDNLSKQLKKLGWRPIGNGTYAAVYENPKFNYVLKIFTHEDLGYKQYLNYIMNNQSNPFVPKLRGKMVKLSATAYAVRMEQLQPIEDDSIFRKYIDPNPTSKHMGTVIKKVFGKSNHPFLKKNFPQLYDMTRQPFNLDDLETENNIMRRGNTIVITDPAAD